MYDELGSSDGGAASRLDVAGGVEPAVGVLDAGESRVAAEPDSGASAECCRFSYYSESAYTWTGANDGLFYAP